MDQDEVSERHRPPLAPFTRMGHSPLGGHEVATPAVASLSPSPRGRDQESTEGSGNAASAHLLGVGVPVIPQARVGQHEPVLLPLPAGRLGGGSGKDRRETDRRLPREAQEQGGNVLLRDLSASSLCPLLRFPSNSPSHPSAPSRGSPQRERPKQEGKVKTLLTRGPRPTGLWQEAGFRSGLPLLARPGWTSIPS